eukprot:712484-Amphidinium_carterae.1
MVFQTRYVEEVVSEFVEILTVDRQPGTLTVHRHSLSVFVCDEGGSIIPDDESAVFERMSLLCRSEPPSRCLRVLKSLLFVQHVFDFPDLAPITSSKRIKACVKKASQQRSPLPVDAIAHLEKVVCDGEDTQERLVAGVLLLCIFTKARWHEVMHAYEMVPDGIDTDQGFIELLASTAKTLKAELKGRVSLSLTAPVIGISGHKWARECLALRQAMDAPVSAEHLLLPTPPLNQAWGQKPMTSGEGCSWLRHFPHHCKVTTLSWCCKYGLDATVRAQLGYHRAGALVMVDLYGRDATSSLTESSSE